MKTMPQSPVQSPGSPHELSNLVHFLTTHLRPDANWTIQDEYPQVFQERNIHNLKFISLDGQPVTHAAIRPTIVKTPHIIFKVAAIGSVVTNPAFRGQGLSSAVINECLDESEKQECDFAILWTNLHDFYRKLGFELAGFEEYFQIQNPLPMSKNSATHLTFMNTKQIDPEALLKVYTRHTIHSIRNAEEIRKYLNIPNTQVYTAWNQNQQLVAYAIEGKGADLGGFVHEWGGGVDELCQLFNYILEQKKQGFTLMAGAQCINLITRLQSFGITGTQGFLGMIKIINFDRFNQKLNKLLISQGMGQLQIQQLESGQIKLDYQNESLILKDELALTRLIFGPELKLQTGPQTSKLIAKVFPLPLWIWGWDSI